MDKFKAIYPVLMLVPAFFVVALAFLFAIVAKLGNLITGIGRICQALCLTLLDSMDRHQQRVSGVRPRSNFKRL